MNNVVAKIYIQKKTASNKNKYEYSLIAENVEVNIMAVSPEILALYPDIPIGQSYTYFIIRNNSMVVYEDNFILPPQSKIIITESFVDNLSVNDEFITREASKNAEYGGQNVFTGVCIKV